MHAAEEVSDQFKKAAEFSLILGNDEVVAEGLFGRPNETAMRAKLKGRWLAKRASAWSKKSADVRQVQSRPPQSLIVAGHQGSQKALRGFCSFSTKGLGITPGIELGIVQVAETDAGAESFAKWFDTHWSGIKTAQSNAGPLTNLFDHAAAQRAPSRCPCPVWPLETTSRSLRGATPRCREIGPGGVAYLMTSPRVRVVVRATTRMMKTP